jgi:hypothetical protein
VRAGRVSAFAVLPASPGSDRLGIEGRARVDSGRRRMLPVLSTPAPGVESGLPVQAPVQAPVLASARSPSRSWTQLRPFPTKPP